MSSRLVLRWPALALLALGLSACVDSPFSPYWDRGTYDLQYANNRSVPSTVYSS